MKISAWNIQQGGANRVSKITETLCSHGADVIVLSEFGGTRNSDLCSQLHDAGWIHQASSNPQVWANGVLVASKSPFVSSERPVAGPAEMERWLSVQFTGFQLVGLYFPLKETKGDFWRSLIQLATSRRESPCLLVGDFNTTKHFVDELGTAVPGSEFIAELESAGWTEIWRDKNPEASGEYTWYHTRSRNGFRIDHAYCTDVLRPFVKEVSYSHTERELKISDHSILNIELDLSPLLGAALSE